MELNTEPQKYTYSSPTSGTRFEFELDLARKEALICDINIEYCQPVDLALTVRDACRGLEEQGIKKIIQQITPNDIAMIKTIEYFTVVNYSDIYEFYNVSCDVKCFPMAFMKGLGFE